MKCTYCGNTELFETQAILVLHDSGLVNAKFYACNQCGHVEMFVPQKTIDEHNLQIEEAQKQEREQRIREEEIETIKVRLGELKLIIQDENQKVKAVNAAKQEFEEKSKKLDDLVRSKQTMSFRRKHFGSKGDY